MVGLHRNRISKRWGVLFTCLVTRAVFLSASLSTTDFLLVLRRFIALFWTTEVIHSDNGTNFVGVERELREVAEELYASKDVPSFLKNARIEWAFQPPPTFRWCPRDDGTLDRKSPVPRARAGERSLAPPNRRSHFEVAGLLVVYNVLHHEKKLFNVFSIY